MSPRPRRAVTEEAPELTEEQRLELLGDPWPWCDPGASHFDSEEERRRAWERHGEELTREYVADHPGHRPEAWWAYSALEGYGRHKPRSTVVVLEGGGLLSPETHNLASCGALTDAERRRIEGLEGLSRAS